MNEVMSKRVRRPPNVKRSFVANLEKGERGGWLRSSDSLIKRRSCSMVLGEVGVWCFGI